MTVVKNEHVEFNSDEVAQNILLAKNWKMHKENMVEDSAETQNKQDNKNWHSQNKICWWCQKTKAKCDCWRPTVITSEVIKLLYMAFCMHYTDAQACLYSWISLKTFYNYQNKHPSLYIIKHY